MVFRVCVGTLGCNIVCSYTNYQEVEVYHVQCMLRTKDIGGVRLTSQGPKLTVLCRRQVATEFFFQSPNGKIWSPKSGS